ncbi:hypothetical protein CKAH01_09089 [Colletotrichum kahawae]|uniref:Uncharacterized protein n=1 Tax=Colletotrichum kahawae TaxID=34407 RepID=A0AAD9Y2J4_COLKA|nr:hypothetical protein CKAH01_09089 [Colletotrichum kahawae]
MVEIATWFSKPHGNSHSTPGAWSEGLCARETARNAEPAGCGPDTGVASRFVCRRDQGEKISNATWQGRVFPCRPAMPLAEIGELAACTGEDENTPQTCNTRCAHVQSTRQSGYTMEVKQTTRWRHPPTTWLRVAGSRRTEMNHRSPGRRGYGWAGSLTKYRQYVTKGGLQAARRRMGQAPKTFI